MMQTIQKFFSITLFLILIPLHGIVYGQSMDGKQLTREQTVPDTYVLSAAYPNPFNPSTTFSLKVRDRQQVKVEVYNMLGQPVKLLYKGTMEAGETKSFTFEAGDLPTGIYLYRIQGDQFSAARQVTLLR